MADGVPFFKPGDDLTGHCTAAVVGQKLVAISGNVQADGTYSIAQAGAGVVCVGVAMRDGAIGDRIPMVTEGVIGIVSTGALAAGTEVQAGANGEIIALAAGKKVGLLLADVAAGAVGQVKLQGL